MWIFSLFFGGNRVRTFFLAMSTMMFDVDRNSVKYVIHTNNHTQSINYLCFVQVLTIDACGLALNCHVDLVMVCPSSVHHQDIGILGQKESASFWEESASF